MNSEGASAPPAAVRQTPFKNNSQPGTIVIPASWTELTPDSLAGSGHFTVLEFEAGSQIRRLNSCTFPEYCSLRSICIAASVESIARGCFIALDPAHSRLSSDLSTVTFEVGSKLREIEAGAFSGCSMLMQLCIPASVERMSGKSLPLPRDCRIEIESGNRNFAKEDDFIVNLTEHSVLRYCGNESEVRIPEGIEKVDECCFVSLESLSVKHSLDVSCLDYFACAELKAISIPSSVTFIGEGCFNRCRQLESVSFGPGSKLDSLPAKAFVSCGALESITLPSSVRTIGVQCFAGCKRLVNSPLPVDSEVVRIEASGFLGCSSLQSVSLPSSVEFVGEHCFSMCSSLSSLTFASPSHLRELLGFPASFKLSLSGFVSIPDSVEILSAPRRQWGLSSPLTLVFGRHSRLRQFRRYLHATSRRPSSGRLLVQFSSGSLKIFRLNIEFGGA
jgi:hypothetical protein